MNARTQIIHKAAEEAENAYTEATRAYQKKLVELFPEGTYWLCFHGSKKGYEVMIDLPMSEGRWPAHEVGRGIRVVNTHTGKKKYVWHRTLQSLS